MFRQLYTSSSSACFELINEEVYYSKKEYRVLLNGAPLRGSFSTNVFSLFNLKPSTAYTVSTTLDGFVLSFVTSSESMCLNVKDFGAVGDGKTDDTVAIQTAINLCDIYGRVYIPKGVYSIRPITLKSHLTLELSKGATLLGNIGMDNYPIVKAEVSDWASGEKIQCASWEGSPIDSRQSLINAYFAKDINIVGQGKIDGNAQNALWWVDVKNQKIGRPRLFFGNKCCDVTIHGITVSNSASWTLHPFFCKNFSLLDASVNAPKDSPNTDGCNPESCDGVNIIGSIFSVGDDCVAIKSGKLYMGAKYHTPADNHTIRNCLMQFGHGAIVLGSEMAGGVKNLSVEKCYFNHTDRGLRIKTRRGRGKDGIIDGIEFKNIIMDNVLTPLVINMFYFCDPDGKTEYVWSKKKLPVGDDTPYLGKFTFSDMICRDCEYSAGYFYGLPEQPIGEINISNVRFDFKHDAQSGMPAMMSFIEPTCKQGLYFNNVSIVNIKNTQVNGCDGEVITAVNVGEIKE